MQDHHNEVHSLGYGIYMLVWSSLVVFTGVTVAVAGVDLKALTITVALLVAAVKSTLVFMYFMHIKYEPLLFRVMLAVCMITFLIFIGLTFFDISFR